MKKRYRRISAALITASIALSMLIPVRAAESRRWAEGSVKATLRLDYSQELSQLRARDIQAELLEGRSSLGSISLTEPDSRRLGGYPAQVLMEQLPFSLRQAAARPMGQQQAAEARS